MSLKLLEPNGIGFWDSALATKRTPAKAGVQLGDARDSSATASKLDPGLRRGTAWGGGTPPSIKSRIPAQAGIQGQGRCAQ